MSSKIGRFRKLEVGDAPTSEPRDATDSSIAGPTESQILNEQELLEILDSDESPVPVQSRDDDKNEIDVTVALDGTDMFVPYEEFSDRLKQLEEITQRQRAIEDPETFGAISDTKTYPYLKTSWKQRVLGWFKRN